MYEHAAASRGPDRPLGGDNWLACLPCRGGWSETPLGASDQWPAALTSAVQVMLACRQPMFLWWGEQLVQLTNEAFRCIYRGAASENGSPAQDLWSAVWDEIAEPVQTALRQPEAPGARVLLSSSHAAPSGAVQHWFSLVPLLDGDEVGGLLGVYEGGAPSLPQSDGTHPRVLLVDPDADLRDHVVRLASVEYDVVAVATVDAAMESVSQRAPDVLLVDRSMAEANGDGIAERFHADPSLRQVPIVWLGEGESFPSAGESNDFVRKPFSARELLARLESTLRSSRIRRETAQRDELLRAEVIGERSRIEAALRQSERRYRQVVQGLPAAVYTCDARGRLQLYNDAAVALWGQSPVIGRTLWCGSYRIYRLDGSLLPPDESAMAETIRTGQAVQGEELIIERPDGSRRHVMPHPEPIFDASGKLIGAVNMLVDVTERKQFEAELAATKDDLAVEVAALTRLHDLAVQLARTDDVGPGLAAVLQTLVELHAADSAIFWLYDESIQRLREAAYIGIDAAAVAELEAAAEGETVWGAALASGAPVVVEDVAADPATEGIRDALQRASVRSLHCTPIMTRSGEAFGVMSAHFKTTRSPTDRERQLADLCARHASDALETSRSQRALRDSEELFRAITMNAPVAIFIKDLAGRYTLCNPLASRALGQPQGAVGFTDHELLPPEAAEKIRERDLEVVASGEAAENEESVPLNGVDRQFLSVKFPLRNAGGETIGVCGVAVDVTERKQAQQALRESERRLLLATQAGKMGVWAWDIAANRVSWSESLQAIIGLGPEDLASTVEDFETLIHPEDRQRVQQTLRHALAHEDSLELEFRAIRSDGDFIWLFTNAAVLRENGEAVRLLGATLDITDRKQGEIALRESEERFRTLASHAPVGIFQSDAEGRTIFVNEGWCQMAGVSAEEARGEGWASAIHPDDREHVQSAWQGAVRVAEPSNVEFRFMRPDGQLSWLQGSAVPLRGPDGELTGYIGTIVDITGRKAVEAALRNSERMYRAIGESIDYGIWVCDPQGRNIYSSESFLRLVGLTQEQCASFGWADVLHPDDVEQTLAAWRECVRTGDSWDVEHRFRGVDGKWHPVLARGVPVRNERNEIIAWVGINLDISELKRVENDLRESESRFRHVADNAPVLIWMNGIGGCQFVNKEYLTFVGQPLEKVLGMGWTNCIHPDDVDGYVASYLAAFERKQSFEAQVRMQRADGQYRWLSATAAPRFRGDGAFLGFIGCSVDITEIKTSEEALREADRRKDDFLAMLGHELRNPLAGIVTGAQVLSMLELDEEAGEMQAVIARQATYMSRIVDDLLDVSRIARGKLRLRHQHANLRQLLRDAVEDYRKGHALEGCELRVNIPDEDIWVWADPARLTQAFSNIIHNSYKFSDGPNVITVDLTPDVEARQVRVVISDRGIGMSPETLDRIFEPFTQADTSLERSRGGLGLGLALGRGLIHLHGGTVAATSPGLGQGSTFTITLPYVTAPPGGDADVSAEEASVRRVLIIDDRRDAILPLRKMLQMDGHIVATAEDGLSGLSQAASFRPDVILCDIGLVGDMNGYAVCQTLRKTPELAQTYLVAVTGYGHDEARRMAKEAGFNYHVTKPVNKQQLREIVDSMPEF